MEEALDAALAGGFEQDEDAVDVGLDEGARVHERAVDVRLGGEVDDGVGVTHRLFNLGGVADVALNEAVAGVVLDVAQVVEVAGVGELVEVDDIVVVMAQEPAHEVGADEAGAAGDEDGFHLRREGIVDWGREQEAVARPDSDAAEALSKSVSRVRHGCHGNTLHRLIAEG